MIRDYNVGDKVIYKQTLIATIASKINNGFNYSYGLSIDDSGHIVFTATADELEPVRTEAPQLAHGWVSFKHKG